MFLGSKVFSSFIGSILVYLLCSGQSLNALQQIPFGFFASQQAPFSHQDLGEDHQNGTTSTYNFTGFNIGNDSSARTVYILYGFEAAGSGRTLSSASIDGVSATAVIYRYDFSDSYAGIIKATIPAASGTTGTVSISLSSTALRMQIYGVAVYNQTGEDSASDGGSNPSINLDVVSGGVVYGIWASKHDSAKSFTGDWSAIYDGTWTTSTGVIVGGEVPVGTTQSNKSYAISSSGSDAALVGVSLW